MQTVFRANLDGLVALDQQGVVQSVNPAAVVALGIEEEELLGATLPEEVVSLLVQGEGRASWVREGRDFQLTQTFVRSRAAEDLGSLLLTHDVTEIRENQVQFDRFLTGLSAELLDDQAPLPVRLGLRNLLYTAGQLPENQLVVAPSPILERLGYYFEAQTEWDDELPDLEVDPDLFELAVGNILHRGTGTLKLGASRDGGSLQIWVEDQFRVAPEARAGFFSDSLALRVSSEIAESYSGSLVLEGESRLIMRLPVAG